MEIVTSGFKFLFMATGGLLVAAYMLDAFSGKDEVKDITLTNGLLYLVLANVI